MNKRFYGYDNLKFVLIFFVVFAHLLEISGGFTGKDALYLAIYSFHMPAFIFLMGLFASNSKKILKYIYIYIVFQTIYICFIDGVIGKGTIILQYSTPVWLLWYLLAMIFYMALSPAILALDVRKQCTLFLIAVAAAILVGYDTTIGYYFSLSRTVVYFPFFVLGCILKPYKSVINDYFAQKKKIALGLCAGLSLVLMGTLIMYILSDVRIPAGCFYASYSYSALDYNWRVRVIQFVLALLCIFLFVVAQSLVNIRLPLITNIGENTLPIFLLHGLFVKYAADKAWFVDGGIKGLFLLLFVTIIILFVLGNKKFARLVSLDFLIKNN